jgi:hypothetical protein
MKTQREENLENLVLDGKIILKMNRKEVLRKDVLWTQLAQGWRVSREMIHE